MERSVKGELISIHSYYSYLPKLIIVYPKRSATCFRELSSVCLVGSLHISSLSSDSQLAS
eukprot:scaffold29560_cov154-Skeletonema_menzelii.AAC.2